jgi:hypothetical protein
MFFIQTHSIHLKMSLILKARFQRLKAGPDFIEDEVVSLFLNQSGHNDEDCHKKGVGDFWPHPS